ncbi:GNAT family N-acetyltransferase [Aureimonas altamirensis]|uniref:GNAT family N-acetyltransferase n=1 Tax=Aureimonas altamirensis TaxID=370622 RepID=UPI001E61D921|nr:GNAT family protein [Aureimonas altamirensis]UHD47360.1 GNAT family N-acetyltransferase [Aureimonas altamirensis]
MAFLDWLSRVTAPRLEGDGLVLRLPEIRDYSAWAQLREESQGFLTPWEPAWSDHELSRNAYRERLSRYRCEARERTAYNFFVFGDGGATLYGGLSLGLIRRGVAQSGTLGYWMGERYAGCGHMSAAVRLVSIYAFDVEGLHRLEAACLPSNERSSRLLERAGFRQEGYLRKYLKIAGEWEDHNLYSLLAEDWSRSRRMGRNADRL